MLATNIWTFELTNENKAVGEGVETPVRSGRTQTKYLLVKQQRVQVCLFSSGNHNLCRKKLNPAEVS